jgi:serine/threonine-protein kinase SRPK3
MAALAPDRFLGKRKAVPSVLAMSAFGGLPRAATVPGDASDSDASDASEASDAESDEVEDDEDYKTGGYHPMKIGDTFAKDSRYRVSCKLGWGQFSTVWLVRDAQTPAVPAALKVVKSARHYTETAEDEVRLLRCVRDTRPAAPGRRRVVALLDDFRHRGPHGAHVCMVMEVLGCNLLRLIREYDHRGIPVGTVVAFVCGADLSNGAFFFLRLRCCGASCGRRSRGSTTCTASAASSTPTSSPRTSSCA